MKTIKKPLLFLALTSLCFFASCRSIGESDTIKSINIIDRNGMSETISSKDRLDGYQKTDFLSPQPYQKVMRVYGRDKKGDARSQITSYHPNGQPKQYLEAINNRANGIYREWFPNGQLKLEALVIGGVADLNNQAEESWLFEGNNRVWDEQGHLLAEIFYAKGELQGESRYYHANGRIWKLYNFQDNSPQGTARIFLEDGSLLQTTEYEKGTRHGTSIRYWSFGKIAFEETYDQGALKESKYFDSKENLISEIKNGQGFRTVFGKEFPQELQEYKNGVQEGIVKIYDENRNIVRLFSIKNGEKDGEEINYYPTKEGKNPQSKLLISWQQGIVQGPIKTWYEDGTLETLREMSQNKKNGLFTAWYKNGSLMFVEQYDNDKIVKGDYFRMNEKIPSSRIEKGQGIALLHNAEGLFLKKIIYREGKPDHNAG